jgi:hypothetical protein
MRPLSVYGVPAAAIKIQCGLTAVDHGDNTYRYERTRRDVRLADVDWYHALFQVAGWSAVTQNEHTVRLAVGDIGLVDGARPSTRISENGSQWLSIYLPRQSLISHLGYEPRVCLYGSGGTIAARLLRQLVLDSIGGEECIAAPAGPHMRLALYDLLGAVLAHSDPGPVSRHADGLFARICSVIKDRCADQDFGPSEVSAETGISLRYVQKLLTARGCTCGELIFHSFGSGRAASGTPGVSRYKSASQRNCACLRLSRLCAFCQTIPASVWSCTGRPCRRGRSPWQPDSACW